MGLRDNPDKWLHKEIEVQVRVRYGETDQMGVVHHINYLQYFEVARMEQFRAWGHPYGEIERSGIRLMIIDMQCKIRASAYFDEVLLVKARVHKMTRFRIVQYYEIKNKGEKIIATGRAVMVSVDMEGYPVPLPDDLYNIKEKVISHSSLK